MKRKIWIYTIVMMLSVVSTASLFCFTGHGIMTGDEINSPAELSQRMNAEMAAAGYDMSQCQIPGFPTINQVQPQKQPSATAPLKNNKQKSCEHEYSEEVIKEPTCAEPGERKFTCSKCGNTYTEEIPATEEHDFEESIVREPTCTTPGQKVKTCKICGKEEKEAILPTGHDYGEPVVTAPTCTKAGKSVKTCKNCGHTEETMVPAKGHTASNWEITKPAGWFSPGTQEKKCVDCGETLESQEIPQKYPNWILYMGIIVITVAITIIGYKTGDRKKKEEK